MKKFNDYLDSVGELKRHPTPVWKWAAYKAGSVSFHDTRSEALAVSNNIEQVETEESIKQRKEVHEHNVKIERYAFDAWWYDFQLDYQLMPAKLFELIYSEAYDKAHAYGYDAIAEEFDKLADFANRILDAAK